MDKSAKKKIEGYISSINQLYEQVDGFLGDTELKTSRTEVEINEKRSGKYKAQALVISDKGNNIIAELKPIAAWVIAAKGRIDLVGKFSSEILVLLDKGGPVFTTKIMVGDHMEKREKKLLKGVEKDGWYWLEDRKGKNAQLLDKELLDELISMVSDYDLQAAV